MLTMQFILQTKEQSMNYLLWIFVALMHIIIAFCLLSIYTLIFEMIMLKEESVLMVLFFYGFKINWQLNTSKINPN